MPITSSNWHDVLLGVSGGMVDSTMVGGKFLMRRGELLTVNEQEMAASRAKWHAGCGSEHRQ